MFGMFGSQPPSRVPSVDVPVLIRAAMLGSAEQLAGAAGASPSPDVTDGTGMTALMALVRNPGADSAAECIELLRSIGSDFLLADNAGFTALHYAAMTGNAKAARQIVKLVPAAVTVCDKTGSPPISLAVSSGKITVVRALLSLEDGVEASPESGEAAAPIALSEEAAVSLTLADAEGNTALHYASASGAGKAGSVVPCAQLLARLRPELLTTLNVARLAPADLAIVCGNNQVAEALLEAASS